MRQPEAFLDPQNAPKSLAAEEITSGYALRLQSVKTISTDSVPLSFKLLACALQSATWSSSASLLTMLPGRDVRISVAPVVNINRLTALLRCLCLHLWTRSVTRRHSPTGVSWWSTSTVVCCTACTGVSSVNHTIAASSSVSPAQFLIVSCSVHTQGRSQYEARRGNCLVLFSSATNSWTFVPR